MAQISIPTGNPIAVAAASSGSLSSKPQTLVGFLCTVAGTLTLYDGADTNSPPVLAAMPVAAGQYLELPITFKTGIFYSLATAAGTFIVGY